MKPIKVINLLADVEDPYKIKLQFRGPNGEIYKIKEVALITLISPDSSYKQGQLIEVLLEPSVSQYKVSHKQIEVEKEGG